MATAEHELRVIYDPAISTVPLIVEADATPTESLLTSTRGTRIAAAVLVPLSIALVALRVTGMMPHAIHAGASLAVVGFLFAYPAYRLTRWISKRVRLARIPVRQWELRPEPSWIVFNWAWTLSVIWVMSIPFLNLG